MSTTRWLASLALCVPPNAHAQTTINLGLAGTGMPTASRGDFVALAASEAAQGLDLNGDGALDDFVLHLHQVTTGATTNTGLTLPPIAPATVRLGDRLCTTLVREASLGAAGTDLNGDGDATDDVHAVHDLATGVTTNLALAGHAIARLAATQGPHLLFGVSEWSQGVDLNGDGDAFDIVLHYWTPGLGPATNVGRALAFSEIAMGSRHALFLADESAQGVDLNGDGNLNAAVVQAYDLASGAVTNLGYAAHDVRCDGDLFAFTVFESLQGLTDLDGDGDASDTVLFAYLAGTGTLRNLARSVNLASSGPQYDVQGYVVAWASDERRTGPAGTDWNNDGDTSDAVLFTHHARTGLTLNSGLAVEFPGGAGFRFGMREDQVATGVSEVLQGASDLNGDGDAAERVAMLFDARTGTVSNLGLAVSTLTRPIQVSRELLAFAVNEASQGRDLNADGVLGHVVAVHRFSTGTTTILRAPAASIFGIRVLGPGVVYLADENPSPAAANLDMNGDGDVLDDVLVSWDAWSGITTNHRLAVQPAGFEFLLPTSRTAVLVGVGESLQGAVDLNGDGDANDTVVHVLRW